MKEVNLFLYCLLITGQFSYGQNVGSIAKDPNFFPIAVWMQSSRNAAAYHENGINIIVGADCNQNSLDLLRKVNMKMICEQNEYGLSHLNDTVIYAWMHGDEPDNAQWNKTTEKYDPCIDPAIIIKSYQDIKKKDPARPVYINLGQGVSYIDYNGRGACRGNIDKYKVSTNGYLKACDIGSFDIYPVNNRDKETQNNLWYVAKGIDSLKSWTNYSKPVWCWIECTKIDQRNPRKPTTMEVKSEVWMALIHGAGGFGYFCHQITPVFDEPALLHDPVMIKAVKAINIQVASLATVLNSPTTSGYSTVNSSNTAVPIDIMTKNSGKINYIFAVGMRQGYTTATFTVTSGTNAEVLGEGRNIDIVDGQFSDEFAPFGVHLYKIKL